MARGKRPTSNPEPVVRVRTPNREDGEMFAFIIQMLGHDRVRVRCEDGEIRIGRIIGKFKKRIWLRIGDLVLIVPWDFQSDQKCDVVWRYRNNEIDWLQRNGILKMF